MDVTFSFTQSFKSIVRMTNLNIFLTLWIPHPVNLVDLILNGKHDHLVELDKRLNSASLGATVVLMIYF